MALSSVTLVIGGARSGKSAYAEGLVAAEPAPWLYIATAEAGDDEMRTRILAHKARRGAGWRTIEAPLALTEALRDQRAASHPVLVDCLTLWLANLMTAERDIEGETERLIAALEERRAPAVLVSNEVGLGIVPDSPLGRRFRDAAGRLNQRVAAAAGAVIFVAAGLPLFLKRPD